MIDQITPEVLAQLLQQQQQQSQAKDQTFESTAQRGCTLLEKLTGVWTIVKVSPSKGGERGINPILTLEQSGIVKRSYTHPSNLPGTTEPTEGKFTWSIPKVLTNASTVTIKDGNAVFNW